MRSRSLVVFLGFGLFLGAVGCESNLSAAKVEKLQMRQTTEEQMKAIFGDPDASGLLNSKDGSSCYYRYYSFENHGPFFPADMKSLMVEMRDNRMNGYVYCSSADKDVTRFDASAVTKIKSGTSTRDDVTQLLGPPAGHVLLPSLVKEVNEVSKPDTQEVWVYTSGDELRLSPWNRSSVQMGFIAFDKQGRAQNCLVLKSNLRY